MTDIDILLAFGILIGILGAPSSLLIAAGFWVYKRSLETRKHPPVETAVEMRELLREKQEENNIPLARRMMYLHLGAALVCALFGGMCWVIRALL